MVDQIAAMRALTIRKAIQTWVKHGIKVNRNYTPTNMARAAAGITGKSYSSSKKSLAQAADDIAALYPEACK